MELPEIHGPDLAGVIADATAAGLAHVVIGGFAAIERFLELADARRYSDGRKLALDGL